MYRYQVCIRLPNPGAPVYCWGRSCNALQGDYLSDAWLDRTCHQNTEEKPPCKSMPSFYMLMTDSPGARQGPCRGAGRRGWPAVVQLCRVPLLFARYRYIQHPLPGLGTGSCGRGVLCYSASEQKWIRGFLLNYSLLGRAAGQCGVPSKAVSLAGTRTPGCQSML